MCLVIFIQTSSDYNSRIPYAHNMPLLSSGIYKSCNCEKGSRIRDIWEPTILSYRVMANRMFIVMNNISNSNIQQARMPTKKLNDSLTEAFGSWVRREGESRSVCA